MYVYIYIYICMYVYVCMYIYIYICIHTHVSAGRLAAATEAPERIVNGLGTPDPNPRNLVN